MPAYDFKGKHVLVTGASGGLGSAIIGRLADRGAHIVATSRSLQALQEMQSGLAKNARVVLLPADLADPDQVKSLAHQATHTMGHIDVLINNAGVGYFALMEEALEENIRHLFEVNTFAPLALTKALLPQMTARGSGRIINIVSSAGRIPIPSAGVYGGSKSALAAMANAMRLEVETKGIDIINIYPGTVDTAFEENALREKYRPGICPIERCGKPRFEVADRVLTAAAGPIGEVWLEKKGRWMALGALLWPRLPARSFKGLRDKVVRGQAPKARPWRLLQVESSLACNLKCIMCPWRETSKAAGKQALMSEVVWEAIRPHLPQVTSVDFTGGGEPLLQPHLTSWVGHAHDAGCETGILTNGLLLTSDKARQLIEAGLDWICVSIDGATADVYEKIRQGSSFEKVCANLKSVNQLRAGKHPKVMINFVIMAVNAHQMDAMVMLAQKLGVDQINFKQCDVIRGDHGKHLGLFATRPHKAIKQLQRSLERARKLAKKHHINTTAFAFTPSEQPVCEQDPRNSMFIRYDGTVAPCINLAIGGPTTFLGQDVQMPEVHYGRLPNSNLEQLWETRLCNFFRERFKARNAAHEKVYMDGLMRATSNLERLNQQAIEAMPKAPKGCRICHYLYDI